MAENRDSSGGTRISRRSILGIVAGTAAAGAGATTAPAVHFVPASDLVMMDAAALAAVIHSRKASCVEVMTAYLDHIDRVNPAVNALVALESRDSLLTQVRTTASAKPAMPARTYAPSHEKRMTHAIETSVARMTGGFFTPSSYRAQPLQ